VVKRARVWRRYRKQECAICLDAVVGRPPAIRLVSWSAGFSPWRWKRYVPPKRWFIYGLHVAISQKTVTFNCILLYNLYKGYGQGTRIFIGVLTMSPIQNCYGLRIFVAVYCVLMRHHSQRLEHRVSTAYRNWRCRILLLFGTHHFNKVFNPMFGPEALAAS
jgi:hypothetical protein